MDKEAIARVRAAVEKREAGVQKDRERAARSGHIWTDDDLAQARSWATVSSIGLDDLHAILALQSSERGEVARITAWDAAENEIARVSSEVSFADTVPEAKRAGVKVGIDLCLAAIRLAASRALRDIPLSSYATLSPAEPSPESREAWQPIETAPKDGDSFLGCNADYADGCMEVIFWDDQPTDSDFPWGGESINFHKERFTHWMPLPALPASALSAPAHD
jgi:hypothetical protein